MFVLVHVALALLLFQRSSLSGDHRLLCLTSSVISMLTAAATVCVRAKVCVTSTSEIETLSDDVLLVVGEACSDPLALEALANLATTSNQILTTLRPQLEELRAFRAKVRVLCSKKRWGRTLSRLAGAESLDWIRCNLTMTDLTVLGRLLQRGTLPHVQHLRLCYNQMNDEGIATLVQGNSKGALRSLKRLSLNGNRIGDGGIIASAGVISTSWSLGSLTLLSLSENQISDAGMIMLSEAIGNGTLRTLQTLTLNNNEIGDEGIRAFFSSISSGALGQLNRLHLGQNRIGLAECKPLLLPSPVGLWGC